MQKSNLIQECCTLRGPINRARLHSPQGPICRVRGIVWTERLRLWYGQSLAVALLVPAE